MSIKTGTVTASLMMRKLGAYPRQNGLALALRELGRMERTLFLLYWLQDLTSAGKSPPAWTRAKPGTPWPGPSSSTGSAKSATGPSNSSATAPAGWTSSPAAIVLWNTVYLDRTITTLNSNGSTTDPDLLRFLSPLGWEHINLTGDYTWPRANQIKPGNYRPLRRTAKP